MKDIAYALNGQNLIIRKMYKKALLFLALLNLAGATAIADQFDGVWRSRGYGHIWEISQDSVIVFQFNHNSVMRSALEVGVRQGSNVTMLDQSHEPDGTYQLSRSGDILTAVSLNSRKEYCFELTTKLPHEIERTKNPQKNFEYLYSLFLERYPFFTERGARWTEVGDSLMALITSETTDGELFEYCSHLLNELGFDGHVWIRNDSDKVHSPSFNRPPRAVRPKRELLFMIGEYYLDKHQYESVANGKVIYKILPGNIGYINILSFYETADSGNLSTQVDSLKSGLSTVAEAMTAVNGVIVDVRYNGGGYDALALVAAGLLADKSYVAFSVRSRLQNSQDYTEPRIHMVEPLDKVLAEKKVVVLSSKYAASATEVFLMSTLQMQNVVRMGEPSAGILSDTSPHELPNGWQVAVYSERYYAYDGRIFEVTGVPVDREVNITEKDFENNLDPVIETAIEYLQNK